ncbi:MAG: leucine-rich repeat protein, partial [Clostridia bacterium]|nr:leucine-rich repeat protein [Clostridia bacterium]
MNESVHAILASVWPDWQITDLLGSGTYGDVFRIVRNTGGDSGIVSESALKILSVPADNPWCPTGFAQDFHREIHMLESLKTAANVVHIEDYHIRHNADRSWTVLIRMELLHPLHVKDSLDEKEAVRLGIDICSALEVCESKSILHRDIKPGNILRSDFGQYKLGDFGISRIMDDACENMTQKIGTPSYTAPEITRGSAYDHRADLYSLGMVMYTLTNDGHQPFHPTNKQLLSSADRSAAQERRLRGDALPPPQNASGRLAEIILKACAFHPEDRYANASEFKRDLLALSGPPSEKPKKSRRFPILTCLLAGMVLVLSGLLVHQMTKSAPDPADSGFTETDTPGTDAPETSPETTPDAVSIVIASYPTKTTFAVGEEINPAGMKLTVTDSHGDAYEVSSGYTCEPTYFSETGMQTVTVTYGNASAQFRVSVQDLYSFALTDRGDSYILTSVAENTYGDISIPAYYNGKPVTAIQARAFGGCYDIHSVHIPATVTDIMRISIDGEKRSTFAYCHQLKTVTVDPENPVYHAAGNCIIETETKTLVAGCAGSVIPDDGSVTAIDRYAFCEVSGLETLVIPETVTKIGEYAFKFSEIEKISIPASVTDLAHNIIHYCRYIKELTVHPDNPVYYCEGNCIIERETGVLIIGNSAKSIPQDAGITAIGEDAFFQLFTLKKVVIPEGVTEIRHHAFHDSQIYSLSIPSTVDSIDENALQSCDYLHTVVVDDNNPVYCDINTNLVNYATKSLVRANLDGAIPEDKRVTILGMDCFQDMNITSLH